MDDEEEVVAPVKLWVDPTGECAETGFYSAYPKAPREGGFLNCDEEYIQKRNAVKPLEWTFEMTADGNGRYFAKSVLGRYEVFFDDGWFAELDPYIWYYEPVKSDCRISEARQECIEACNNHHRETIAKALV